ncbi:MAG: polyprenyl synthetase family protein [Thermomicrobiales bacterium]
MAELEDEALPRTRQDLPIYGILRYHLGYADESFQPATFDAGKRIRPRICLLACQAAGGDAEQAMPVAAAIEMVHNFTLIHDDIQDHSDLRRHRPTVWSLWDTAQAINAGDALFAAAHMMLMRSSDLGLSPTIVLALSSELHRTTLRIVEGQVLDLGFEHRSDVAPDEYLAMIGGKSAAIMRYACFAGATVAEADPEAIEHLAAFGQATGMAFQIRTTCWASGRLRTRPASRPPTTSGAARNPCRCCCSGTASRTATGNWSRRCILRTNSTGTRSSTCWT